MGDTARGEPRGMIVGGCYAGLPAAVAPSGGPARAALIERARDCRGPG